MQDLSALTPSAIKRDHLPAYSLEAIRDCLRQGVTDKTAMIAHCERLTVEARRKNTAAIRKGSPLRADLYFARQRTQ